MAKTPEDRIVQSVKKRNLSPTELERVLSAHDGVHVSNKHTWEDYYGKRAKFGVISDTHIGQEVFDKSLANNLAKQFKKEGIDVIYHCGDILEGMSGRPGHVYELAQIGFENQMAEAVDVLGNIFGDFQVRGINGNHDAWYMKKNDGGVSPSRELEIRLDNYQHLGDDEAHVELSPNVTMLMFHPNDGTAYATSYKIQKLVESFTGAEKPEIVIEGHYHKSLYMFSRNIHAIEAGTVCGQTSWMRGRKIPAHKGGWILDIEMGKGGIGKFSPTFLPGYK